MDGFVDTLTELMTQVGVEQKDIHSRKTELPSYFRPSKAWDLVVTRNRELLAAIELKSHVGPSFGNNFNNRTEEAMGLALDTWTAYREQAFAPSSTPWLGYLLLLEDSPQSSKPVRVIEPHFEVFQAFKGASYARRYEVFCRRLVLERQYNAACFMLSDRRTANDRDNYSEPAHDLSAESFLSSLIHHVRP